MRAAGLRPHLYESAEQFLADQAWPGFGCLVLDVQLGGMSGFELAAALADEGVRAPIIFVTASDDPAAREAAARLGGAAFFRKSDPGSLLLEAIRGFGCAASTAVANVACRDTLQPRSKTLRASRADEFAELDRMLKRALRTAESMSRMARDSRVCTRRSREIIAFVRRTPALRVATPDAGPG